MAVRDAWAVARPYAEAVFAVAKESKKLEKWREMLSFLATVVGDEALLKLYRDPSVDRTLIEGLILEAGREVFDEGGRNFVRLLLENGRLELAPTVYELYEKLRQAYEEEIEAEVVSAKPMTKKEQQQVISALRRRFGRRVKVVFREDPSLLGGVVIRYGDKVIDGSVWGQLLELKRQLLRA